jgi:hypothetical protein
LTLLAIVSKVSREILVERQLALKYKQKSQNIAVLKALQPYYPKI